MLGMPAAFAALAVFASPALAKPSYLSGDRSLANRYAAIEGAKLGVSLPGGAGKFIEITESPLHRLLKQETDGTPKSTRPIPTAATRAARRERRRERVITISRGARAEGEEERRSTIAHEVFHAFQAVMSGTLANFYRAGN